MKYAHLLLIVLTLVACADSRSREFKSLESKNVYLNVPNDADLIAPEIMIGLQSAGFKVDSSTSEAKKYQELIQGNAVTGVSISKSQKRYEVIVNYGIQQNRFVAYNIVVRDRDDESLVATKKYRWDRLFPAPSIDSGVQEIVEYIDGLAHVK